MLAAVLEKKEMTEDDAELTEAHVSMHFFLLLFRGALNDRFFK